jgi:hypothetical protein
MGTENNGLTLQGLAHRLEALQRENAENAQRLERLEHENERMRAENTELRNEVAALGGSGTHGYEVAELRGSSTTPSGDGQRTSIFEGRVTRRSLLSKGGAAAIGIVAAGGILLNPREANAAILSGTTNTQGRGAVEGTNENSLGYGVWGNSNGFGVYGTSPSDGRAGVVGEGGFYGVLGQVATVGVAGNGTRYGVWGRGSNPDASGVLGQHQGQDGQGKGVYGLADNGTGVLGDSMGGIGVRGESSAPNLGAVKGHNDGGGTGVVGVGKIGLLAFSHTDGWNAVWGRHTGNGRAVVGDSARGYGGEFKGGKAQLRLAPADGTATGKPTTGTHSKGEIYMDSAGTLFVCTADGTPGTWRRFTTTAT